MMGRRLRAIAAVTVVLVSAACGQKAGVGGPDAVAAPAQGATATTASAGAAAGVPSATDTTAPSTATAGATSPTTRSGPAAAAAARSGSAAPAQPSATAPSGSNPAAGNRAAAAGQAGPTPSTSVGAGAGPADPHDRDGVTDKEIVIGIHAPITGAAPVPQDSVDKAKDLYWRYVAERGGIHGRNVRVVFRDDQFNP